MGNRFICMTKKESKDVGSRSKRMGRSQRKLVSEEELHLQALSMALQQHQLSQRFEGSMSRRIGSSRRHAVSESFAANSNKQVSLSLSLCACFAYLYNYYSCHDLWVCDGKVSIFESFD